MFLLLELKLEADVMDNSGAKKGGLAMDYNLIAENIFLVHFSDLIDDPFYFHLIFL